MDQNHRTRRRFWRPGTRPAVLLLSVVFATSAQAKSHFITFINDADRTVTSIEVAPAGTHLWHAVALVGSLIGGRSDEATVRFDDADTCKQDLSVTYLGLPPLTITGFDICRTSRLYLGKALAKAVRQMGPGKH